MAHLPEILVPCREARAAKMGAAYRVAREPATMSTKMMSAKTMATKMMSTATKMMSAAAKVPAEAVTAAVSSAAPVSSSSVAPAPAPAFGERGPRQRHHEDKNRNCQRAP